MTLTAQYRPYRDEECTDVDHIGWPEHEPAIQIYEKTTETIPYHVYHNKRSFILILSISVGIGIFGFLLGYYCHSNHQKLYQNDCLQNKVISSSFDGINHSSTSHFVGESSLRRAQLLASISSENIRTNVREFSRQPHLASSKEDLNLAIKIRDHFNHNHFDHVSLKNYSALLSLPDSNRPNFVSIIDSITHNELYSSLQTFNQKQQPLPFSPYSPNGDIIGDILFVNYGRPVDFIQLQNLFNTTNNDIFNGKIFLVKQFHLSASEQYRYASALNASALLFYPDPQHYNPKQSKPFPDSLWLPSDGIRNDGIFWNGAGDPETFGLPSNSYAYRNRFHPERQLTMPAQPISYEVAEKIFQHMDGMIAPNEWKGGLNVTYRIGTKLKDNLKIRISVNNRLVRKTIYNVIGMIYGNDEPDRYVIIGNQRDSMSMGAIDSASGTGTFMEMARVFGDMIVNGGGGGWRPRRTLMFCSWGSEEFNLIGSTEFVEDFYKILYMRAVAYINVNLVVNGNDTLSVAASPLLYHSIFNATKDVFLPRRSTSQSSSIKQQDNFNSIYDKWIVSMPKMRNKSTLIFQPNIFNSMKMFDIENQTDTIDEKEILEKNHQQFHRQESADPGSILKTYLESAFQEVRPHVRPLDMYGSYAPFYTMAGIPVADISFINIDDNDNDEKIDIEDDIEHITINHMPYPLLHSQYDRIEALENFIDPDYRYHVTIAQILVHLVENLADSSFIPFNLFDFAQILNDFYVKTLHMYNVIINGRHRQQRQTFSNKNNGNIIESIIENGEINSTSNHSTIMINSDEFLNKMDLDLKSLESAIKNFSQEAIKFHGRQDKINTNNPLMIRQMNDKLLLIERQFLDHRGLPSNNLKRHLILSPAEMINTIMAKHHYDGNGGGLFPAIIDELDQLMGTMFNHDNDDDDGDDDDDDDNLHHSLLRLQKHLPILIHTIQSAANSLSIEPF
uniref:N-acetylated-alpha-linked acidic dipeptidase 2-like n=2 Tax=Dermatophagoides pteronyssinus TaxID=6956 RepID=A0A6P6Y675_DERPT|nr:N-acetylated-alpha-linked acidic dipeptidase 2-like [Dermatophagoides pteronyssinus]